MQASNFTIGPSSLSWDGQALTIQINELTVPIPSRIRGVVRLYPTALHDRAVSLDAKGQHRWRPIAPCARVEVALQQPALRWSGAAYLDSNSGDTPLEDSFSGWTWSRASLRNGTAVLYDVDARDGVNKSFGLRFNANGAAEEFLPPAAMRLPDTLWRVNRTTPADADHEARVIKTLEDAPFYARSVLSSRLLGEPVTAVHESLSLDRFRANWVQMLLPFRMPRELRRK